MNDTGTCYNLRHCPGWDGRNAEPTDQPFCHSCLDRARTDIGRLVYDYVDLAQLHEAPLSQAPAEHTSGGGHESPTLLADHIEALQAEILHVTATWEHALRTAMRLPQPGTYAPLWSTTVYDHMRLTDRAPVLVKARPGHVVQRAVQLITGRLDRLATLPATTVCPTGIEDQPTDMHGWEAVHQLQDLHGRCRSVLGRTQRTLSLYGACGACGHEALYRQEPARQGDEPPVWCENCSTTRTYAAYEHFLVNLVWPDSIEAAA